MLSGRLYLDVVNQIVHYQCSNPGCTHQGYVGLEIALDDEELGELFSCQLHQGKATDGQPYSRIQKVDVKEIRQRKNVRRR